MDDAAIVCVLHRPRQRFDNLGAKARRLWIARDLLRERSAADIFQRKIRQAIDLAHLVDLNDVLMLELGDGLRFRPESIEVLRTRMSAREDHLERNESIERDLSGAIDHAHSATSQFVEQLITRHGWLTGRAGWLIRRRVSAGDRRC